MKFVFHTNSVSPHQLPLAREIVKSLGADEYKYVYTTSRTDERRRLGWGCEITEWVVCEKNEPCKSREWIEGCDVLMSGLREVNTFERRCKAGLMTIYASERWFKPRLGIFRLLIPSYFKMVRCFVKLLSGDNTMYYFPMGIHAARDMARLCGLLHGDLRCIFRAPQLDFERKPGGRIWLKNEPRNTRSTRKYCLDKMRIWGYFVRSPEVPSSQLPAPNSPTKFTQSQPKTHDSLKVLWVGRLLEWKRVDTIIKAVGELSTRSTCSTWLNPSSNSNSSLQLQLDIYGTGPMEARLKKMAARYGDVIKFHPPVPIDDVRKLMREHDIYVLASNSYEGWGAVVSEALEEGVKVFGTYEAGASATILPETNLFHAGDWRGLQRLLTKEVICCNIGLWTAEWAARALLKGDGTLAIWDNEIRQ